MKFLAIFCFILVAASAKRQFRGDQVLRIKPKTFLDVNVVEKLSEKFPSIDFWTDAHGSAPVDIHVPAKELPAMKAFLAYARLDFDVFIDDLQAAFDDQVSPRPSQMNLATFDYNVYHPLAEIDEWMDDMVAEYSSLITKITYGTSYEGRPIHSLKLSKGGFNKPAFVIDCGLHAREWVAPATCMYTAKYLMEDSSLLDDLDIYITTIGNPDGYVETWTGDRMWRKTRSPTGGFCLGVDPNRNWDVNWSGPGASSSSCNDAYYGPSVMSEVEVSSKAEFIKNIPNVKGYIDIHAYSQYWMHPYAFTYATPSDYQDLYAIGHESATAIKAVHGQTYLYGSISGVIYQASGSTTDYMYEKLGIKCSFAAELRDTGLYGFTLPERLIQPTAEEAFAGLKVIANAIIGNRCNQS